MARLRALPAVVKGLAWVSFFTDASSEMIYPLLPAFLLSLGAGAHALGIVEGAAESTGAFVKWWAGKLSDRAPRRKPFVMGGYAIATFVRPLLALASTPWHVVVVRSVDRVGKGLRSAPRDAMVAETVTPDSRGLAYGFHRMMDNAGGVLGPALAFALASLFGWPLRRIFLAAIVPGLAAMATLVFFVKEAPVKAAVPATTVHTRASSPHPAGAGPLAPDVLRYLAVVGVFTLAASADTFLILRLIDLGLPKAWAPLAWLSLNAMKSITNIPGGAISDRFGRKRTLVFAWLLYAAAYLAFPLTKSVALSWLLLVGYGAYYGLAEGGEKAIVADLAPVDQRGRAFGALHAVTGFMVLPANLAFGFLYAQHAAWAFGLSAFVALVAALLLATVVPTSSPLAAP